MSIENKVDLLRKQINEIQEKCEHRFFSLDGYKPKETLERGTFRVERGVRASCLDCSKEVEVNMTEMCPRCFGEMAKQKERKDCADELYSCKKCDFTVHQINRTKLNRK